MRFILKFDFWLYCCWVDEGLNHKKNMKAADSAAVLKQTFLNIHDMFTSFHLNIAAFIFK